MSTSYLTPAPRTRHKSRHTTYFGSDTPKWPFSKRTVLQMTEIKGTEKHGLLQTIIRMIRPPPCSSVPLQKVVCKEDGSRNDQNQRDVGAGIVKNDHPDDPASSVSSQMVICKEDCISDDQNQRDGGARIVANDIPDDPASSVSLHSFANGHLHKRRIVLYLRLKKANKRAGMPTYIDRGRSRGLVGWKH